MGYNFKRKQSIISNIKQLTIMGYFTSKEGRTGATNYQPNPGKYQGDVPYKKGDKVQTGLS